MFVRFLTFIVFSLAVSLARPGLVAAVETQAPMSIEVSDQRLEMPVLSNFLTPAGWVVPRDSLVAAKREAHAPGRGYILYNHNWHESALRLARSHIGEEITLHFQATRSKVFVIQSIFSVGAKSHDRSELANDPNSMLIYSSSSFVDRDRLVILAKEKPSAEVSSTETSDDERKL
ncbi:hypothetical protein KA012_04140 [Candidatus Woesebacteria bacterium]|nr:hypothetical protein [Candidatus Woesebacteria bacterium]